MSKKYTVEVWDTSVTLYLVDDEGNPKLNADGSTKLFDGTDALDRSSWHEDVSAIDECDLVEIEENGDE